MSDGGQGGKTTPGSDSGDDAAVLSRALLAAAKSGPAAEVERLLAAGAEVDSRSAQGGTPLMFAAAKMASDKVRLFLEAGADPNAVNNEGFCALYQAAGGSAEVVEILLEAGADPDRMHHKGGTPVMAAADKGPVAALRLLVDAGADLELGGDQGYPTLCWAVYRKHAEKTRILVAAGANLEVGPSGWTPLMLAAKNDDVECARALVEGGAKVEAVNGLNETALFLACEDGHVAAADYLIKAGTPLETVGPHQWTALLVAATHGHTEIVLALMKAGADVQAKDDEGLGWAQAALAKGHKKLVTEVVASNLADLGYEATTEDAVRAAGDGCAAAFALLGAAKVDLNGCGQGEVNPLLAAVDADAGEAVTALLEAGAEMVRADKNQRFALETAVLDGRERALDAFLGSGQAVLDVRGRKGRTALHWAVAEGRDDAANRLLAAGASSSTLDSQERGPLHAAVSREALEWIAPLLAAGADIDGGTPPPIVLAAEAGAGDAVQALLDAGASVDALGVSGATPLITAARRGHVDVVRQLLRAGANPAHVDGYGRTASMVAADYERAAIIEVFVEAGVDLNQTTDAGSALFAAIRLGDLDVIDQLIASGVRIDEPDSKGRTALHGAVVGHHRAVVGRLLEGGANPNSTTEDGFTPLHLCDDHDIAQQLLSAGAEVDATSKTGRTPLMVAAEAQAAEVVKLLLSAGADPNRHWEDGLTVLHSAVHSSHQGIGRAILAAGADVHGYGDSIAYVTLAALEGASVILDLLIEYGADLTAQDSTRFAAIAAVKGGSENALKCLLDAGFDPSAVDPDGHTAATLAASTGIAGMVGLLAEQGET